MRQYANGLTTPYCGPADGSPAAEWSETDAQSLACIALRPEGCHNAFGILVLASEDASRFTSDMGTDYLETIGRLASAAATPARYMRFRTRLTNMTTPALPSSMAEWLAVLGSQRRYSRHTLDGYRRDLLLLCNNIDGRALDQLNEGHIRLAVSRLHSAGHHPRSLARMLSAWRGFYGWWAPRQNMPVNPVAGVRAPKSPRGLPKALSVDQTQSLLDRSGMPPPASAIEWRDQAMFEVLYSSGLRLAELVSLDQRPVRAGGYESISWIDLDTGDATVLGKGGKTRSVPLGSKAMDALRHWLAHRHELARDPATTDADAALFLGARGARISPRIVQKQLADLAKRAGLPVHVHPHSLRHSFASHLLQSAQDLRAVQELLGHANISTTQIYTRLDFQHLAKVYDQAHPRAQRKRDS